MDPRFPAGLPFPVPEILDFVAFRDSGKIFQLFSRDFPGVFLENPRRDPGNSHSLLEFSDSNTEISRFSQNSPDRGLNPQKFRFSKFPGSGTEEKLVNSVFCCFSLEIMTTYSQNSGLVYEYSATPQAQLNWTGPIANGSDLETFLTSLEILRGRERERF